MLSKNSGMNVYQVTMFSVDLLVPQDHLLRKINDIFDWNFVYELTEDLYSSNTGRPSIDPVIIIKVLFLEYLDNNGSVRKTLERCQTDIAYRYFLGLSLYDSIPHHTTFSKLYERKFKDTNLFKDIFDHITQSAIDLGVIDQENIFVDSTHVKACANPHKAVSTYVENPKTGFEEELTESINEDRANHNKKALKQKEVQALSARKVMRALSEEETRILYLKTKEDIESYLKNLEERTKEDNALKEARKWFKVSHSEKRKNKFLYTEPYILINGKLKPLTECMDVDLNNYSKKKTSKTDCQSGWFHKGEHKSVFAYTVQTACDINGYILSYTLHPGNMHDSKSFFDLYNLLEQLQPQKLIMDSGYNTPTICRKLLIDQVDPVMPYRRPRTKKGFFKKYEYAYDELYDCYICPNNQVLEYSTTNREGYKEYKSNSENCKICEFRDSCTHSKDFTKIVTKHVWDDFSEQVVELRYQLENVELYGERKKTIERSFGTSKESHGMRYTRYVGTERVEIQIAMTYSAQNLKKMAKHYPLKTD